MVRARHPHEPDDQAGQPPRDRGLRVLAPVDCTEERDLGKLIRAALKAIGDHPSMLVIDLSKTKTMNCLLLSSIVFLAREADRQGVTLKVEAAGSQFEAWASAMGVASSLARRGIVG